MAYPKSRDQLWWSLALLGQFLFVFAAVALSGPGRIDIVDGQTRYEVARSLVEHGDSVIRDDRVWFGVFPGRSGELYSTYRFPQTALGAAAILVSDATGPVLESRRHFFFTLIGALACAVLAVVYTVCFRHLGQRPAAAFLWATAGVFCMPSWFYGTSTFDDILGSPVLVFAVVLAFTTRHHRSLWGAGLSGLAVGLAFNCKQPLGAFVLVVLAANLHAQLARREILSRAALILIGLAVGIAVYEGYDLYKFPPGSTAGHAELLKRYVPNWPGNPVAALLGFSISPAAGAIWYCPPLLLALSGIAGWYRAEKWFCWSVFGASALFVGFLSLLTIFKGDPAWGPRYLTPLFALLWIFVPSGAARVNRSVVALLLALGLFVQLGALSVDPHRLYIERGLPSSFGAFKPWLYFHPAASHLLNRPREILEVVSPGRQRAMDFTPSPAPTFAFPIIDFVESGPEAVRKYHVLNSLRPWWISHQYLPSNDRPVEIWQTVLLLVFFAAAGLAALIGSLRRLGRAWTVTAVNHNR